MLKDPRQVKTRVTSHGTESMLSHTLVLVFVLIQIDSRMQVKRMPQDGAECEIFVTIPELGWKLYIL